MAKEYIATAYTMSPEVQALVPDDAEILPPVFAKYRKTSRIVKFSDGHCAPILQLIATAKYGELGNGVSPYWYDGDHHNESFENVNVLIADDSEKKKKRLGPPSGTKEYRNEYYKKNKERIAVLQKAYQQRRRLFLKEIAKQHTAVAPVVASQDVVDSPPSSMDEAFAEMTAALGLKVDEDKSTG